VRAAGRSVTAAALAVATGFFLATPAAADVQRQGQPQAPITGAASSPPTPPAPAAPAGSAATPAAAPARITTIQGITEYRLPNGLRVLLGPDSARPMVTMNLVYQVGSRHEGPGEAGMAHLLEHMLFKGTAAHPDPKQEFSRRGMRWNGTTSYDRTNYYAQFTPAPEDQRWLLRWFADTMTNLRITPELLDGERPVVRNEMQSSENRPQRLLYQQLMSAAYEFHPYGRTVIGTETDLANVQPAQLQDFYHRYYRPDNAVLIVTGQFDEQALLGDIAAAFADVAQPKTPIAQAYTLDRAQQGEREVHLRRAGGVPLMYLGYHMPVGAAREAVAMAALALMLTRQPDGPLYEALVKPGIAVSVYGYPVALQDPGLVQFGATLADESRREEAWRIMRDMLEDTLPLSAESLARTKQDFANSRREVLESPESLGLALTEAVALGDWRLFFAQGDWMEDLTLEEVQAVGRNFLVRDNRTLAWYVPTTDPRRAPEPARVDVARLLADHPWRQQEAFQADFALTPQSIAERTVTGRTASGIDYALLPRRTRSDRVTVSLRLQWGDLASLSGRWKDADMLDRMMQSGTRSLPLQQFEDSLRKLDARMDLSADETGAWLGLQVTRGNLDAALALAAQALKEPVFPADVYEERKRRLIASIESRRDQPESLVADMLRQAGAAYPAEDPRHHRPPEELIADLRAHTLARMERFYREFAGASHGQFAVVGDIDPQAMKAWLEATFSDWKSGKPYQRIERPFHPLPAERQFVSVTDKPNAVYLQTIALEMSEDDPDYPALALAMRLFGGDSGSRVSRRLREQEGLTYGAYATLSADRKVRHAAISIRAIHAPANLQRVEAALQEEIERVLRDGFTATELEAVRQAWAQRRNLVLGDESNVASILASNLYWSDTMQRWMDFDEKIRTMSLDEVNAAFRRYVRPDRALVLGAGEYGRAVN
jgi:zinc protease